MRRLEFSQARSGSPEVPQCAHFMTPVFAVALRFPAVFASGGSSPPPPPSTVYNRSENERHKNSSGLGKFTPSRPPSEPAYAFFRRRMHPYFLGMHTFSLLWSANASPTAIVRRAELSKWLL